MWAILFILFNHFLGIPAMLESCNRRFLKLGECRDSACWAVVVHTSFTLVILTSLALSMVLTRYHPLFSLLQSITHGSLLFQAEYSYISLYETTLFLHNPSKCICSCFFFCSFLCLLFHMYLKILGLSGPLIYVIVFQIWKFSFWLRIGADGSKTVAYLDCKILQDSSDFWRRSMLKIYFDLR